MCRRVVRLLTVAVALGAPSLALAQGGVTGSIVGNVFDQAGVPLKGVKVSARSETQIGGVKTTYTNDEGFFRFVGLLPGEFEVAASAPKLKQVQQKGVKVGVSASAEVTLLMEVETAVEEVKVLEKAPVVSTTSANVKEVYDEEFMDNLPIETRFAIEEFVGNNVAGGKMVGTRSARMRGGNVEQNAFMVDGFYMNGQKTMYKSLSAMEVQTAAYGADGATTPGGLITMVTKTGSNKFELDVNGFHENGKMAFFKDAADIDGSQLTYINPNFSGPIVKDKLWFYVNLEGRSEMETREKDPLGLFVDPPPYHYGNLRGTAKLTWQITPRYKLQSFTVVNRAYSDNRDAAASTDKSAQYMNTEFDYFTGLTAEALLADNLFFRTQAGMVRFWKGQQPQSCREDSIACDHDYQVQQTFPVSAKWGNYSNHSQQVTHTFEFVNTLEWFAHSKLIGDHSIKLVSRYFQSRDEQAETTPGGKIERFNGTTPDRLTYYYSNDPRIDGEERFGYRITSVNGSRWTNSFQDSARITRYLTVNPGVAVTIMGSENSEGEAVTGGVAITPHVSVAWDATHDGRTVLRASFNNYVDADVGRLARHSLGARVTQTCRWSASAQAYNDRCEFAGGPSGRTFGLPCGPQGFDEQGNRCDEKLKIPRTWEYTVGAEREVVQGLALGGDVVYRDYTNPYSTKETNRIWNRSGGALEPTGSWRNGRAGETVEDLETPSGAGRQYLGVTAAVAKREGALKMNGSYTWAKLRGNVLNTEVNSWGDIPPRDPLLWGYLPDDSRHTIKATVTYQWARWLSSGLTYRYISGTPYSRWFRNAELGSYADLRAPVGVSPGGNINDPGDDRELRLPDLQTVNLQLRLRLKPLIKQDIELFVDVMNALALRTTTAVVEDDTPLFGSERSRMRPMRARLGFRFRY